LAAERLLHRGLVLIGTQLTPAQLSALKVYSSELLRWAQRANVTGFRSEEAIVREGFLRSLTYRAAFEPVPGIRAVDIGSGAGFPGLVLKVCYPGLEMVLVESARRRAAFLRHLIRRLGLSGIRCLQARAEELHGDAEHRGRYQLAFARALGALPDVVSLAEPFLSPGGRLILHMGRRAAEALPAMRARLAAMGMRTTVCEAPAIEAGAPPTHLLVLERASSRDP